MFYPVFDPLNIGRYRGLTLKPGTLHKENIPLFSEDFFADPPRLWEPRFDNAYPNVFYDAQAGLYRCYYTSFIIDEASAALLKAQRKEFIPYPDGAYRVTGLLYAQSRDGITWEKPALGVQEFAGSRENNILFANAHGASVFLDAHETDPARRYKMIMKHDALDRMAESFSADGIHWSDPLPWENPSPAGDTHNHAFYDERCGKYVLITRTWDGVRISARCESTDFIHWSEPEEVYRGMGLDDQLYAMPVFPYAGGYIGLGAFYHDGDRDLPHNDCVDLELLYSRDTLHWERVSPGIPFIPRGPGRYPQGAADCGCVFSSVPVQEGEDYWFYYMGGNGRHTSLRESTLLRARINARQLAGYAAEETGALLTRTFMLTEDQPTVSAEIGAGGWIKAALCEPPTAYHQPLRFLPGAGFEDTPALTAGGSALPLSFPAEFRRKPVCLAFELHNAVLYGFSGVSRK